MQDKIAERAYFNFLNRGGSHGNDLEDWYKAEQEIVEGTATKKTTRTRKKAPTTRKKAKKS